MEDGKDSASANTGGSRVSKEVEALLAKLVGARSKGTRELKPDELATIREVNEKLKPIGRSVSKPISEN